MPKTIAAVEEVPFRLYANERRVGVWTCTPQHRDALAVGRLLSLGYLRNRDELLDVDVADEDGTSVARVRLPEDAAERGAAEHRAREQHGCGLLHYVRCAPELIRARPAALPLPRLDAFPALFRELYAASERYRNTGGLHSAALSDGRRLRLQVEEVGRHNAVDKVIGRAILTGADPRECGLITTARISAEIALKAARAGLSWVASRSVPTTLAVRLAGTGELPILARAARPEPRLFVPPEDRP